LPQHLQGGWRSLQDTNGGRDEDPENGVLTCLVVRESRQTLTIATKGAKIRSTYITYALKEKTRLEDEIRALAGEVEAKGAEVSRLRGSFGRYRSLDF
jgi:hypothetical protein